LDEHHQLTRTIRGAIKLLNESFASEKTEETIWLKDVIMMASPHSRKDLTDWQKEEIWKWKDQIDNGYLQCCCE